MPERPTYASAETMLALQTMRESIEGLQRITSDHAQRFETLQTPFWKRIWFWIDGWPWHDLNGQRRRRPWHR